MKTTIRAMTHLLLAALLLLAAPLAALNSANFGGYSDWRLTLFLNR